MSAILASARARRQTSIPFWPDIETSRDGEIDAPSRRVSSAGVAVGERHDLEAGELETRHHELADVAVVIGDEDAAHGELGRISSSRGSSTRSTSLRVNGLARTASFA